MSKKIHKIKKVASLIVGVPAALLAVGEVEDLRFWYLPFVGMAIAAAVLFLNRDAIKSERSE